jgi:hypothetical protein
MHFAIKCDEMRHSNTYGALIFGKTPFLHKTQKIV